MSYNKIKKNEEKIERDLTKERNERCVPIAQEVLKRLGKFVENNSSPVLPDDRASFVKAYDPLIIEILGVLQETKLPLSEWGYVMQLALVPAEHVKNYVAETINKNISEVLDDMWGKSESDVTLEDIAIKKRDMVQ